MIYSAFPHQFVFLILLLHFILQQMSSLVATCLQCVQRQRERRLGGSSCWLASCVLVGASSAHLPCQPCI